MFGQKRWIILFGKCRSFAFFKATFFWSNNYFFLSRTSKNNIFRLYFSKKKKNKKNFDFWTKKKTLYYTLRKMTIFLTFKTFVFNLKFILFLYRIPRNDLFEHNYFENTTEKKIDCWAKTMDQPSRKRSIFWRSTERYLSGLKIILF